MAGFNLEDYETVDSRIKRFYDDHADGRVTTELLSDPNNIDVAVVKASLWIGESLVATGLAFEVAGGSGPNRTAHLENAETSAIGRSLANYKYSGNKRASREEMEKTERGESAAEMYMRLRKVIDDKKLDGALDENAHQKAVAWLDGHARTITGMKAAERKLAERFNHD